MHWSMVILVMAENNCFQESFTANKTVRISKLIWKKFQTVGPAW